MVFVYHMAADDIVLLLDATKAQIIPLINVSVMVVENVVPTALTGLIQEAVENITMATAPHVSNEFSQTIPVASLFTNTRKKSGSETL
jgi:hypothetical protein